MLEIKEFIKLLNILKQYSDEQFLVKEHKDVNASYLHDNNCLIAFYCQFELKNLIIQTGVSSISFIDYSNLKERNAKYSFSSLKKQEYIVFSEQTGGGNPILFNFLDKNSNPSICASYDVLEPFKIASNFHQFIQALVVMVDIVYNEYNMYEIYTNDDCDEIKPEFLLRINIKLSSILGENTGGFVKYFFG